MFVPVAAVIKFGMANNTTYGLAAHISTQNVSRAILRIIRNPRLS